MPQQQEPARSPASHEEPKLDPCLNLYRAVCGRSGPTRDPSGTVRPDRDGELAALRLYEKILRSNRSLEAEQADELLVREIYSPQRLQRLRSAFDWVRNQLDQFIESQPEEIFSSSEKGLLKKTLRKIELQLPPPVALYADEPDLFTKSGVYYERLENGSTRIRVGGAYLLSTDSWFNLVFTLAHELSHAIDPCELRALRASIPAYDRLSACLMHQGVVKLQKGRLECGDSDQLSEAFADWMAVQIVARGLRKFSTEFDSMQLRSAIRNSVRDLCEQEESLNELDLTLHPAPRVRIEAIFGSSPSIRELLGCPRLLPLPGPVLTTGQFCDFSRGISK